MAIPRHVAYLVSGTNPGGEIWTNTLRFTDGTSGAFTGLDLVAAVQQVKDRWAAMLNTTGFFADCQRVTSVSGYVYDAGGNLVEQAITTSAPVAGTALATLPHSSAIVASLLTGIPGRSYRGRLYLPLAGAQISTVDMLLPSTSRQTIADEVAEALDELRSAGYDVGADGLDPVVVSTTLTLSTPITQVRVGSVPDVQRRRRNALIETYSTATVAP